MSAKASARRDERGSALVELTWIGLLLIIPLVYAITTIFTVQRSAYGATEATRSAARAYILAPDVQTAERRALAAAELSMGDQGVELRPGDLVISCHPTPSSCLQPGSSIEVSLDLDVRLPLSPSLGGDQLASIAVHASHTEPFGTYREPAA